MARDKVPEKIPEKLSGEESRQAPRKDWRSYEQLATELQSLETALHEIGQHLKEMKVQKIKWAHIDGIQKPGRALQALQEFESLLQSAVHRQKKGLDPSEPVVVCYIVATSQDIAEKEVASIPRHFRESSEAEGYRFEPCRGYFF